MTPNRTLTQNQERNERRNKRRKRNRELKRRNLIKARKGGSRLVDHGGGWEKEGRRNQRTCLLNALMNVLQPDIDGQGLAARIMKCTPTEGDTSVNDVSCAVRTKTVLSSYLKNSKKVSVLFLLMY